MFRRFTLPVLLVVASLFLLLATAGSTLAQDFDNPSCGIETFTLNPSYSAVPQGTHIELYGRGNCDGGVRAVRFEVFGIAKAEIGDVQQWETFKTEEFSPGTGLICFSVAGGNNTSWLAAERRCFTITIEAPGSTSGSQTNSSGSSNNTSSSYYNGGMDVAGWCRSLGYAGATYDGDAYSWRCTNSDGSYGRSIDVDPVCVFSSGGSHPYAGLRNVNDAYSWFCDPSPQGRPSSGDNTAPVQNNPPPANTSETCSFAPLSAGDPGRITAGISNRFRSGAGTGYSQIGTLTQYTQFTVVSGPYSGSGYCWYEVRLSNGSTGYTAAGTSGDPWIEWWSSEPQQTQSTYDLNPSLPGISPINVYFGGTKETTPNQAVVIDGFLFVTCVVDGRDAYMLDRYAGNDLGFFLDGIMPVPVGAASRAIEKILTWFNTGMTVVEFFKHHPQVLVLKYYISNSDGNNYITLEEQGREDTRRVFTIDLDSIPSHGGRCQQTPA